MAKLRNKGPTCMLGRGDESYRVAHGDVVTIPGEVEDKGSGYLVKGGRQPLLYPKTVWELVTEEKKGKAAKTEDKTESQSEVEAQTGGNVNADRHGSGRPDRVEG